MRLSICMMVKNEEKNLECCLKSLQVIRNRIETELIIVDTGSDDGTVEIAGRFTDKIFFQQWANDFSAMRNISIKYAIGEWILIIDADEELNNAQPIVDFLQSPQRKAYGAVAITTRNIVNANDIEDYTSMVGFRLFKNDGFFHYEGAVHNQAMFKGESLAMPEAYLLHYGYLPSDKELMERKFLRTSAILKRELEKNPQDIYYWTQLSVTYAMHNDYAEAIKCAEKAYWLLPEKKTPSLMYVLLQLILVYQHEEKYEKVAEVCREALAIKEGYLDVTYYYAESQAMLKNYAEAITYYEKYLQLLEIHDKLERRDVSLIEYSLGYQEVVYFNLSQMAKEEKQYDKALYYAEKISDKKYIDKNMLNLIELYVYKQSFFELRRYFEGKITEDMAANFMDILAKKMGTGKQTAKFGIANAFRDVKTDFGLLCTLILAEQSESISPETESLVNGIKLENLPVYCSDILYYLLKRQYPLTNVVKDFKEVWLTCAFDYIAKQHDDLGELLYVYLQGMDSAEEFSVHKLNKALGRYTLLLNKLTDEQCKEVFERYIHYGIAYLHAVYSAYVIDNQLVHELKNDEEVYLLHMYYALLNKENNQGEYVKYLRKALQAFPGMKRGIEMLLRELQDRHTEQQTEFDKYKIQIKATIQQLIDSGKMDEAKAVLGEYKNIVSNDMEAILLESRILLN